MSWIMSTFLLPMDCLAFPFHEDLEFSGDCNANGT
jgi:hypothetical protein